MVDFISNNLYYLATWAFIFSIVGIVWFRLRQARVFGRTPVGENEFRVIYSTNETRLGPNFGIVSIKDGEVVLYDKNRIEILRQSTSDVKAKMWHTRGYPWDIISPTNAQPTWNVSLVGFWGWQMSEGLNQLEAFSDALRREQAIVESGDISAIKKQWGLQKKLLLLTAILLAMMIVISRSGGQ
jgi:hypothetical protein